LGKAGRFAVGPVVWTSALALVAVSGCAFQQKKVEKELSSPAPIHCTTAEGDIRMLRSEKANVLQRMAEGVTAVYPASLVVGTIAGVEGTKLKVAAGDYNKLIDARIAAIQQKCGVE
jgi:hypothetical protein